MYKVKHRRPLRFDYDLLIIGTGSGGGVAAHLASKAGHKVALVEADTIGGECPNYGCVPTKALLQAADTLQVARNGARFGIKAQDIKVDWKAVQAWKDQAVEHTGAEEGDAFFKSEGIKVINGYAHFLDPWTVSVGSNRYRAKHFLIATGTMSAVPPIPGLKESGFLTYREAIALKQLPESIFVVGGGAIGTEFSELFNSFGVKVHIADLAPRLLAVEDPEAGELLTAVLEQKGVSVHTGVKVSRIHKEGTKRVVTFEGNGQTHQVTVDSVLLASGKVPNTDLGLENAGVKYNKRGITVNPYMQTSAPHIYAAGDVVGPYRFTHTAAYQSRLAAHNMFHREKKIKAKYYAVPRCVFTDPEIASVGVTEQQLKDKQYPYQVAGVPISVIGRANTSGVDTGFVKVLATKKGVLLGATIVSPRAGEMIQELTLAINHRMTARQVAETIHAFPTWGEAVRIACQKIKS